MLNEKAIDKLIQPLIDRQTQIEMAVIEKIAKRLGEIKTMLPSDVHKLETLLKNGSDAKEINKTLSCLTQLQEKEIKKIIKTVAQDAYEDAKPYYDYRQLSFVPYEENEQLQKTIKAIESVTLAEYDNLSNATAFMLRDPARGNFLFPTPAAKIYQKVVDMAIQSVVMGPESYNAVIPRTIKQLIDSGLKTEDGFYRDNTYKVAYSSKDGKSKRYVRLDSVVRRSILDGISTIYQEVDSITGEQFDADGVELSVHSYSAPDHEPVQGHQFTKEEFEKLQTNQPFEDTNGISFEPILRPIGVWNCYHIVISIIIDAMPPAYTLEQLEEIKKNNANGYTYKNKDGETVTKSKYWCTQKKRAYELEIKKAKEGRTAAILAKEPDMQAHYQAKVMQKQNEYRQFCEDCGLEPEFDKTRIYTPADTIKSVDVKTIDKSPKSGIMKVEKQRGINFDMTTKEKHTASGHRRTPYYKLTHDDIEFVKSEIVAINANVDDFVFNSPITRGTCFLASDNKVYIKGNVFPDEYSEHPRDRLSVRAVLAHEYYGHRPYRKQYLLEDADTSPEAISRITNRAWADEFRASYMAAKNAPSLSKEDKVLLIRDALTRAEEAGVSIKYNSFMRRVLYD